MGGLFSGPKTQITTYSGLQVQDTTSAKAIPIVWGQNMLTPNCIDYRGFNQKKKGSKSGGKGGTIAGLFGGSGETVYYADVIMAICEGPIADIIAVYQTSLTPIPLSKTGLTLQVGNIGQSAVGYWVTKYPAYSIGYSGVAYVWAPNFDLGPSASIGTNSLVIQGFRYGTGFNGIDADPALVITDFLTSPQYGVGFPSLEIGNLTGASGDGSLQAYCQAAGLAFSPVLLDREAANTILDRWLNLLNCTCVWSSGILNFIPRGDTSITANGWTFNPNLTVQYYLDDDAYYDNSKGKGSDPVQVSRSDPYELDNSLSVEIIDRLNNYNAGPIPVFDQSAMDRYGKKIGSSISAHEITHPAVAQIVGQLALQRGLYIRRQFKFKLSWQYCQLDPMDIVSISDSRIGLNATLVRITEIEEDDNGILSFTAEEFVVGVATASPYAIQAATNGAPDATVVPNVVNTPIAFEPPPALTQNSVQIWVAISPQSADPNWGGCVVNASWDGTTYASIGQLNGPSTMGATTASLAAYGGSNPDNTNTLSVDISESGGALLSTTSANAALGASACWVDGEIIAFTTATLVSAGKYNLTGLYRGLYGTTPGSHASNATFALLSSPLIKYTLPSNTVSNTVYMKFQSFNIFNQELESLSSCTAYSYTVTGSGLISNTWTSYTATWTTASGGAPSVGNGTLAGNYYATGLSYTLNITLTTGSTTTFGGGVWRFAIPVTAAANSVGSFTLMNGSTLIGSGVSSISGGAAYLTLNDSTLGQVTGLTYIIASGSVLTISINYQAV